MEKIKNKFKNFANIQIFLLTLILINLINCQKYQPLPLSHNIDKKIQLSDIEKIQEFVKKIQHPILKPINIDLTNGINPEEAAIIAIYRNPFLKVARSELLISNAEVIEAGLYPNPQLSLSMDKPNGGTTSGTNTAYSTGLGFDLENLITHSLISKKAKNENKKVKLSVAWQEIQIAETAKITVYQIVTLKKQLLLLNRLKKNSKIMLEIGKEALSKGIFTENNYIEYYQSDIEINKKIENYKKNIIEKNLLLNKLLGITNSIPIKLEKNIIIKENINCPSVDILFRNITNRRLDLLALKQGYLSSEENVRIAVLNQFPKINFGLNSSKDNSNLKTIGLGFSIGLPIFNHSKYKINIARATRQKLNEKFKERVIQAQNDIYKIVNLINYYEKNNNFTKQLLKTLKNQASRQEECLKLGIIDKKSLLNTKFQIINKQIDLIEGIQNINSLNIMLSLASGYYSLDNLNFQKDKYIKNDKGDKK